MEKKEYESIEAVANKLQSESARQCDQKTREAQKYHYGYIQGVEDLLKVIRRGRTDGCSKCNAELRNTTGSIEMMLKDGEIQIVRDDRKDIARMRNRRYTGDEYSNEM